MINVYRKWGSVTRELWVKIDESGRGELKIPGLSVGLSSSRDVARLNEVISEAKVTGSAFIQDDGRPLTVWRGKDSSINIQGVGESLIHFESMDDVAKLQKLLS